MNLQKFYDFDLLPIDPERDWRVKLGDYVKLSDPVFEISQNPATSPGLGLVVHISHTGICADPGNPGMVVNDAPICHVLWTIEPSLDGHNGFMSMPPVEFDSNKIPYNLSSRKWKKS